MEGIISVQQAAKRLGEHVADVRGAIKGLGIQPLFIGRAHCITASDYKRLAQAFKNVKPPIEFESSLA